MNTDHPVDCACGGRYLTLFTYTKPPEGETKFSSAHPPTYFREIRQCNGCLHCISVHAMDLEELYGGDYMTSTYGRDGIRRAFERILALPPEKSDNAGRLRRLSQFAAEHWGQTSGDSGARSILDVGSGLCVFLHGMKSLGWECTALDPDERAVLHAREVVKIEALWGDFLTLHPPKRYDVVTFNKVLEHVEDPVTMLSRAHDCLTPRGFVYVELPDAEAAALAGPGREEFFIEHHHIFSGASTRRLATEAGFRIKTLERMQEPSSKYTLRAFLLPA